MNHTIYADSDKNAIRFSNFKKLEVTCPFAGLGVKYVASGEEIYYANDKKYKVNAGEYIIGNVRQNELFYSLAESFITD